MNALAILGCATIAAFLLLVAFTRTPVIAALVLTPVVAAVAGGLSSQLGSFAVDGLKTVAPVASLMMFAVLYFGLMIDVGLFAPLIERLIGVVRGDPVRLCLATAALAMLVALDGGYEPTGPAGDRGFGGWRDESAAMGWSNRPRNECAW